MALVFLVFLYLIRAILLPFVLGVFTAYFLNPANHRLQHYGLSRNLATIALTAVFFLGFFALGLLIVPLITHQLSDLLAALPDYTYQFEEKYGATLSQWAGTLGGEPMENIKSIAANISDVMIKFVGEFIANLFQSGMAIVNLLSLILITPVVAFYLLRDWDELIARLDRLLPRATADTIRQQLAIIDDTLAGFVRGQVNVCLILATYYAIGLSLIGLKFGIVIGVVTGLLVILPYVGFAFGCAVALTTAFFQFDATAGIVLVAALFGAGQVLESYFLTPKLVGERVGLHPVWIIFGMLSGAALFGFVGVLLAVPATAVIGVWIRFATTRYLHSSYYLGTPPQKK